MEWKRDRLSADEKGNSEMKKIYVLTGARGSGKSTALARFPKPSDLGKMLVIDTEDSMSDIIESNHRMKVEFGEYIRAYERFKMNDDLLELIAKGKLPWASQQQKSALVGYYEWFVKELDDKLKKDSFRYLAIDTIEPIEAAMTAWAETNKSQSGWSGSRAYGRLETEAVRPLYENLLEAISRRGVETILMSSHLKRVWENDKPILNKLQPGGRITVLSRLSSMMLWLVQSDNPDGAPAAIVLKARKAKESVENGDWSISRPLPQRIPHFTWKDVRSYEANGCDLARPAPGETLSDNERAMISEFLTDEQMRLMVLGAEIEAKEMTQSGVVNVQENPIEIAPVSEPISIPLPMLKRNT
jgi:energy-coupling factor transporter ATP-binding protein EcfA2